MKLAAIALSLMLFNAEAFAQGLELQQTIDDNDVSRISLQLPLKEGKIDLDFIGGIAIAETDTGRFVKQNIDGAEEWVAVNDGEAQYLTFGVQGRRLVLNREWLEAVVRAAYDHRIAGTTIWSEYSQQTGELYDPVGGVNAGAGINFLIGGRDGGHRFAIGLEYATNVRNGRETLYLKFGLR